MAYHDRMAARERLTSVPTITQAQIDTAMAKAVAVVGQAIRDPGRIEAMALGPTEARQKTAHWRDLRWSHAPWCFMGYIGDCAAPSGWVVWWDPETDRVWLKREGR